MLDRHIIAGNVGIKSDIAKVFDTMDWGFLLRVLRRFGFADRIVDWIDTILHSVCLSIAVNGVLYGYFFALEAFSRVIHYILSCFVWMMMC